VATYESAGFVRELRAGAYNNVHHNIDELYQNDWIDRQTRAVFLELAVYNPYLHIFCAVKCVSAVLYLSFTRPITDNLNAIGHAVGQDSETKSTEHCPKYKQSTVI